MFLDVFINKSKICLTLFLHLLAFLCKIYFILPYIALHNRIISLCYSLKAYYRGEKKLRDLRDKKDLKDIRDIGNSKCECFVNASFLLKSFRSLRSFRFFVPSFFLSLPFLYVFVDAAEETIDDGKH